MTRRAVIVMDVRGCFRRGRRRVAFEAIGGDERRQRYGFYFANAAPGIGGEKSRQVR